MRLEHIIAFVILFVATYWSGYSYGKAAGFKEGSTYVEERELIKKYNNGIIKYPALRYDEYVDSLKRLENSR